MKSKFIIGLVAVAVFGGSACASSKPSDTAALTSSEPSDDAAMEKSKEDAAMEKEKEQTFQNLKSPHYVSSEPANNSSSSSPILTVSVTFNFDLATPSKINVARDGIDVTNGSTQITGDKLVLSVPVKADQTGSYKVSYSACWPDKSCHDGSFGFSVKLP